MSGLSDKIMRRVRGYGRGKRVFSPADFHDLGSRSAIYKALSRLADSGDLRRVGRGLYDLPQQNAFLGRASPPSLDAVVNGISRRDGVSVMPDHIVAANALGLTTAVPAKPVFLTSGSERT